MSASKREPGQLIDFDTRKWGDKQSYRFDALPLGRDDYGTWGGVLPPTDFIGPVSPGTWDHAFVVLIPDHEWWTAAFNDLPDGLNIELYIDITTPVKWLSESHLQVIDLDLDVARFRDGRIELLDEDEFAEHRVELGYPDDVADRAVATAHAMMEAVTERREPFDLVGASWLTKLLG